MSIRTVTVAAAVGGLLLSLPAAPAQARDDHRRGTAPAVVVADHLPVGRRPRVAYVDGTALVRPDGSRVRFRRPIEHPLRVAGGHLVSVARSQARRPGRGDIYFVSDSGRRRLFLRGSDRPSARRWSTEQAVASENGRLVAFTTFSSAQSVLVARVPDGRVVRTRSAADPLPGKVLAIQGRRALLWQPPTYYDGRGTGRLLWWAVDSGRITRSATTPPARFMPGYAGMNWHLALANLRTRQVVVPAGRRQLVRPIPGARRRSWYTDRDEAVLTWSPDGRFVTTAPPPQEVYLEMSATSDIRVRRASTGRVVARYRGDLFSDALGSRAPTWEPGSDSFLTSAWTGVDREDPDHAFRTGHRYVRCTVSSTSCTRILPSLRTRGRDAQESPFAGVRPR
ncbi:MAG TPA: hypothetical protein VMF51_06000 [Nocardioides sp.]|uniref:hypothetical protein n=1 Tax=Nocardioides sp. TaxID=35761 RepID=UPI002CD9B0CE|nr:hypothetical protein [Nocardioides sp.]HTW14661.1 hypothetical protein [Nocardioides sp.]